MLGTQINTDELSPLFNAVALGKEDSYKVAEQVLYPLLDKYAVDFDLPDRDADLPSQAPVTASEKSGGLWERIIEFFRKLFESVFRFEF